MRNWGRAQTARGDNVAIVQAYFARVLPLTIAGDAG